MLITQYSYKLQKENTKSLFATGDLLLVATTNGSAEHNLRFALGRDPQGPSLRDDRRSLKSLFATGDRRSLSCFHNWGISPIYVRQVENPPDRLSTYPEGDDLVEIRPSVDDENFNIVIELVEDVDAIQGEWTQSESFLYDQHDEEELTYRSVPDFPLNQDFPKSPETISRSSSESSSSSWIFIIEEPPG